MKHYCQCEVEMPPNVSGALAAVSVCVGFWGMVALALWGLMR